MLQKIISIKQVGKFFNNCPARLTLGKLTLIFAGNGQGKSTLCDILRSLNTGDGRYITGRETLGSTGSPAVSLRISDQTRSFTNSAWDQAANSFLIYDTTFITDNVHSGEHITHNHKKNLYNVIIGELGVSLARSVAELDEKLRDTTRAVSMKQNALDKIAPAGMPARTFLSIAPQEDVDRTIVRKTQELAALQDVARISAKSYLRELTLPDFPADYIDLVSITFEGVSGDIEARVKTHVISHTAGRGESWLAEGVSFGRSDACPFCGQPVEGVSLLSAFKAYFDDAYRTHTARLRTMASLISGQLLGQAQLLRCQEALLGNTGTCESWEPFLSLKAPEFEFANIAFAIERLRTVSLKLLNEKQQAPLEPVTIDGEFKTALAEYNDVRACVVTYNGRVAELNDAIRAKKTEAETGDLHAVQADLGHLQAVKRRYQPEAVTACNELVEAEQQKKNIEKEKARAKGELEAYTATVFDKYQNRINSLLTLFNAGFQIGDTKSRYLGGSPSSHYELIINDTRVELGDPDSTPDTKCFRNTLSAGDKSTLALSFFIASAEHDRFLSDRILVFDDPFTSQDHTRRTCTQQLIRSLAGKAKQVILLSHDPLFLRLVHDSSHGCEIKTMQLSGWGSQGTKLTEWDIAETTRNGYIELYTVLFTFINEETGDKRKVAQTIRLLLEQYMRLKLPTFFADTEWLGDFIRKIRACTDTSSPLYDAQQILGELTDINDYAKKYHHSTPGADTAYVDEGEVLLYAKRALKLVQSF